VRSALTDRLNDGYKAAIALVDTNHDGIVSAAEGDIDTPNRNCPQGDNTCIYLIPRSYDRFAVTREINDGLLGPRFAPARGAGSSWAPSSRVPGGGGFPGRGFRRPLNLTALRVRVIAAAVTRTRRRSGRP